MLTQFPLPYSPDHYNIMLIQWHNLYNSVAFIKCSDKSGVKYWVRVKLVALIGEGPELYSLSNTKVELIGRDACELSSPPCFAYMRQWSRSALDKIMARCLFGAKPLSKALMGYYTPSHNEVVGGYIGFTPSVRLSVRPSVRPSRMPCPLCNVYSSGWIVSILGTNDH